MRRGDGWLAVSLLLGFCLLVAGVAGAAPTAVPSPPAPTPTLRSGATAAPTATRPPRVEDLGILLPTPVPTLALPPIPEFINGVPLDSLILFSPAAQERARIIHAIGQAVGRRANAFSRLGDSVIENPHFLARFDEGPYNLGEWSELQAVIDYFRGSFAREGVAVHRGLHAWSIFDPMWARDPGCLPGEHILACELRQHNPSILFIRIGSNDVGVPDSFDRSVREAVLYADANGVIPILITKADRREGDNINNNILRRIAAEYQTPLIDFEVAAATLPRRGTDVDGIHLLSFFAHDYTSPVALQRGHGVHNLLALIMLDRVWRAVTPSAG